MSFKVLHLISITCIAVSNRLILYTEYYIPVHRSGTQSKDRYPRT